jgi:hypothetical protein
MKSALHSCGSLLLLITASTVILAIRWTDGLNNHSDWHPLFQALDEESMEKTDGPLRLLHHEFQAAADPFTHTVPTERLASAEDYMRQLINRGDGLNTVAWTERGPSNIGGRTRAILVSSSDGTGNTVFAGGVGGGLWKTINFKNASPTWTVVNDFFSNLAITCIKQSPVSNSTMYFGTGEGWGNIDAIQGAGIWKTTDGGVNWSQLSSTTVFSQVEDLEFDANGYIYAATRSTTTAQRGIMRSTDGGTTWVQVLVDPVAGVTTRGADLEVAPDGDMYATLGIFSTGHIFRSPSNGANTGINGSWSDITPSGITTNAYQRVEIAVCPTDANRVYAIAQDDATFGVGAMYRTDNDGTAWTTLAAASWCDQGASTNTDFTRTQAWYDLILAVDPSNSSTVIAGGVVLVKSTNAGSSWTQASRWTSSATCTTAPVIHADIHEVKFISSTEFIVTCDGGIFYTTDGGASYVTKNGGYNVTQYYGMAVSPSSGSNLMLAGAQDNGSHLFSSAGINSVSSITGGDGAFCFIDTTNSTVWITSNPGGYFNVYRTSGTLLGTAGSGNGRFIDPADYSSTSDILYYGEADGLYGRLFNVESGSASYGTVNVGTQMGANRQVSCVKIDPADPTIIWLGCSDSENNTGAAVTPILLKVIRANASTSGAPSTKPAATAFTGPPLAAGSYISNIDIEPGNSNHLILSVSNYGETSVWESTDGGTNWGSIEGNLPDMPVRWAMFVPNGYHARGASVGGVVLATELGVWSTNTINGTSTSWAANNSGMANVRVDQLVIRQSDKAIAAATHGRGAYTSTLLTSPLAVTLTEFNGVQHGADNLLHWKTASEFNSSHFELQRAVDGNNFTTIARIEAAGNSQTDLSYNYTDNHVRSYLNYYRLKEVDLSGESKLSQVVRVQSASKQQLFLSGNPFTDHINLSLYNPAEQKLQISLLSLDGRKLGVWEYPPGTQQVRLNITASPPKGIFLLDVSVGNQRFSRKLLHE